ncbi:SpaA isopeptide-forming pilin-related protein [Anaerococcus tetradius]|uniref:SpaA isopeptide-forming pilin-related protein n=1 Tax=Anaerococcus tetradius TaxID=33036 RepID=UPI0023F28679|nr:SpaA isopeptide-forming pilin-related protein [Anaerococcus tetradius]
MKRRIREFMVNLFSLTLAITMCIPTNVYAISMAKKPKQMPTSIRIADSGEKNQQSYIDDDQESTEEDPNYQERKEQTETQTSIDQNPQRLEENKNNYTISQKAKLNNKEDAIIYEIKVTKKQASTKSDSPLNLSLITYKTQALKDIKITKILLDGKETKIQENKADEDKSLHSKTITTPSIEKEITYTLEGTIDKKTIDNKKLYSFDLSLDQGQTNIDLQRISYKFIEYQKEDDPEEKELKLTHIKEGEDELRTINYKKEESEEKADEINYIDYLISKDKADEESQAQEKNKIEYKLSLTNIKEENTEIYLDYYKASDKGFALQKEYSTKIPYQEKLDLDLPASYILKLTVRSKVNKKDTSIEKYAINSREVKSPRFVKEEDSDVSKYALKKFPYIKGFNFFVINSRSSKLVWEIDEIYRNFTWNYSFEPDVDIQIKADDVDIRTGDRRINISISPKLKTDSSYASRQDYLVEDGEFTFPLTRYLEFVKLRAKIGDEILTPSIEINPLIKAATLKLTNINLKEGDKLNISFIVRLKNPRREEGWKVWVNDDIVFKTSSNVYRITDRIHTKKFRNTQIPIDDDYTLVANFVYKNFKDGNEDSTPPPSVGDTGSISLQIKGTDGKWIDVDPSFSAKYRGPVTFDKLKSNLEYRLKYKVYEKLAKEWGTDQVRIIPFDIKKADRKTKSLTVDIVNGNVLGIFNNNKLGFKIPLRISKVNEKGLPLNGSRFHARKIINGEPLPMLDEQGKPTGEQYYPKYYKEKFDASSQASAKLGDNYFRGLSPGIYELWEEKTPDESYIKPLDEDGKALRWYFKVQARKDRNGKEKKPSDDNYLEIEFDFDHKFKESDAWNTDYPEADREKLIGKTIKGIGRVRKDKDRKFYKYMEIVSDDGRSKPAEPDLPYKKIDELRVRNYRKKARLKFFKIDGKSHKNIKDAEFTLRKIQSEEVEKDGKKVVEVKVDANNKPFYESVKTIDEDRRESTDDKVKEYALAKSSENLGVEFMGIGEGTYILEEVRAADGYKLRDFFLTISFSLDQDGSWKELVKGYKKDENGKYIEMDESDGFFNVDRQGNLVSIANEKENIDFKFRKLSDQKDEVGEQIPLKGAGFVLKKVRDSMNANAKAYEYYEDDLDAKAKGALKKYSHNGEAIEFYKSGLVRKLSYACKVYDFDEAGQLIKLDGKDVSEKDKKDIRDKLIQKDLGAATRGKYYQTASSQADGGVSFSDLGEGIYELIENQIPTGYLGANRQYSWIFKVEKKDKGLEIKHDLKVEKDYYRQFPKLDSQISYKEAYTDNSNVKESLNDKFSYEITNTKLNKDEKPIDGTENENQAFSYPSTGGLGTSPAFTIIGLAMMTAGAIYLARKK